MGIKRRLFTHTKDYSLDKSKAPYGLYMNKYGELTVRDNNVVWRNMNNYTQVTGKKISQALYPNTFVEMLPYDVEDGIDIQGG